MQARAHAIALSLHDLLPTWPQVHQDSHPSRKCQKVKHFVLSWELKRCSPAPHFLTVLWGRGGTRLSGESSLSSWISHPQGQAQPSRA